MVVVQPGGICQPGHDHDEQEEIFLLIRQRHRTDSEKNAKNGLSSNTMLFYSPRHLSQLGERIELSVDLVGFGSSGGWVFDKHPDHKLAEKKEKRKEVLKGKRTRNMKNGWGFKLKFSRNNMVTNEKFASFDLAASL